MTDMNNAIMDAAERRIRAGGFNGFSFREIAVDVGVKSSSVHYHFPTKENLAAAVVRRYTEQVEQLIDKELETDPNPARVWARAFRGTLQSKDQMCPCIVLGSTSRDLPPEVAVEVRHFFKMCQTKMVKSGLTSKEAAELLSTITGAMVLATALDDNAAYDRATVDLRKISESKPTRAGKPAARKKR